MPGSRQRWFRRGRGIEMHTWAPYNPEDHRMSVRRLLSAWSVVALCALAVAIPSAISGTETNGHVTMTGGAQHHAAPWHLSRVSELPAIRYRQGRTSARQAQSREDARGGARDRRKPDNLHHASDRS